MVARSRVNRMGDLPRAFTRALLHKRQPDRRYPATQRRPPMRDLACGLYGWARTVEVGAG